MGMCTGQLAAAALASASTVGELVLLAVQTVIIAFRTGLLVTRARETLETGADKTKNWSYIVPKMSVDVATACIEQFSQATVCLLSCPMWLG